METTPSDNEYYGLPPEQFNMLISAWRIGLDDTKACEYAGVNRSKMTTLIRTNPVFEGLRKRSKAELLFAAMKTRASLVEQGEWNPTKDVLDRALGKATDKVDMSVSGGLSVIGTGFGIPKQEETQPQDKQDD